jgi:hypothetical protein
VNTGDGAGIVHGPSSIVRRTKRGRVPFQRGKAPDPFIYCSSVAAMQWLHGVVHDVIRDGSADLLAYNTRCSEVNSSIDTRIHHFGERFFETAK